MLPNTMGTIGSVLFVISLESLFFLNRVRPLRFSKDHHCIKWQDYVLARLELEECDELCHGNWIEIESLQRQVHFLKKLLEENGIVLPDDYYDL